MTVFYRYLHLIAKNWIFKKLKNLKFQKVLSQKNIKIIKCIFKNKSNFQNPKFTKNVFSKNIKIHYKNFTAHNFPAIYSILDKLKRVITSLLDRVSTRQRYRWNRRNKTRATMQLTLKNTLGKFQLLHLPADEALAKQLAANLNSCSGKVTLVCRLNLLSFP